MASSLTRILKAANNTLGILRAYASWKALSGQISMNFVFGAATSHWVTGSTWIGASNCLSRERDGGAQGATYDNMRHLERDGDLGDCPHTNGRVQENAPAVDEPEHTNNGDTVPNRAVIFDLAPMGDMDLARGRLVLDNSGYVFVDHPLLVICDAWSRSQWGGGV
jgi:hypothetical protein